MSKVNGRSEAERSEAQRTGLDLEHELPAADTELESAGTSSGEASAPESELQKLRAERDSLLDRLARMQAEFENVRRRNAKEQQDFREYAATDTIKPLLPVLDSFERALQVKSEPADFRNGVDLIYKQLLSCAGQAFGTPDRSQGRSV